MGWQRRWYIDSKEKWRRIVEALLGFGLDFAGHPVELIVREVVEQISPPQRRLFHAICADAAPHFGMTPGEFKIAVKAAFFGESDSLDRLTDLVSGISEERYSTEDLEHEMYGWLIETAYRLAAENGVFLADRRPR